MNLKRRESRSLPLVALGSAASTTFFAKVIEFPYELPRTRKKPEKRIVASSSGLGKTSSSYSMVNML
jgi:hypothetical protein